MENPNKLQELYRDYRSGLEEPRVEKFQNKSKDVNFMSDILKVDSEKRCYEILYGKDKGKIVYPMAFRDYNKEKQEFIDRAKYFQKMEPDVYTDEWINLVIKSQERKTDCRNYDFFSWATRDIEIVKKLCE